MANHQEKILAATAALAVLFGTSALAQDDCDAACQAARNAQDPLAPVTALFTDNTIGYGPEDEDKTYNFQLQGATTIETDAGNLIFRGILPFLGRPDDPLAKDIGVGDTVGQVFWVPTAASGGFKLGYGPQFSIKTRDTKLGGPGNGLGFAVVGFGFAGDLSYGGILGHLWGEDDFSVTTVQPIVFYNLANFLGGSYVGYNNSLTYNWNTERDRDGWTVPVGLTLGKTWPLANGGAFDASLGAYAMAAKPDGANESQFKFSFNYFFP
ncbi:hypothetical protein CLV78_105242 [Aliiruegeria haliotis]|uniref:Outer membrane beta-barrel porin/alpha-amylase n=1 Tax=Aliiruegeria haliotis TaxID=1280846 RepID=A0A2T0RPT1_9RHOB|nr:hypothetical protein [Aliiruegeria haliotis]PRY23188.1 hypothetical protein CLV78_105242 [Aliiruegeria haliotis]